MNILVVDDNPNMRDIMARVLEREGHKVFKHNTALGVEGLMKAYGTSLLLTDHDLGPDSDTVLVLAERVKSQGYEVIIMSGNYVAEEEAKLLDIPFFLKAGSIKDLLMMIEEADDDRSKNQLSARA